MDKKVNNQKATLVRLKLGKHSKRKTTYNSSARTPKHLESIIDQKNVHLSKFKTMHVKPDHGVRTAIPPCMNLFNESQSSNIKNIYKTNQTEIDLPQSHSEKTITMCKFQAKQKENNKNQKTSKKRPAKRSSKIQVGLFEGGKQFLTTRKSSIKKPNLKILLFRTEKILQSYQRREEQWLKQRQSLVQQVEKMRSKQSSRKCITHSASSYLTKKHLY